MTEFTQVATIPKTAQRCKAEGIGLSENQLRTLCARGELKHTQMGKNDSSCQDSFQKNAY